ALLNGFGGAASTLVAWSEVRHEVWARPEIAQNIDGATAAEADATMFAIDTGTAVAVVLSLAIGALTFTGSMIAFAKLQELMTGRPITFAAQKIVNAALMLATLGLAIGYVAYPDSNSLVIGIILVASVLGVLGVIPIGGADMPVVISLLNSYSGLAACATGFVLANNALIISGALVGASGLILTQIMCRAMNRSLANVLFGA